MLPTAPWPLTRRPHLPQRPLWTAPGRSCCPRGWWGGCRPGGCVAAWCGARRRRRSCRGRWRSRRWRKRSRPSDSRPERRRRPPDRRSATDTKVEGKKHFSFRIQILMFLLLEGFYCEGATGSWWNSWVTESIVILRDLDTFLLLVVQWCNPAEWKFNTWANASRLFIFLYCYAKK